MSEDVKPRTTPFRMEKECVYELYIQSKKNWNGDHKINIPTHFRVFYHLKSWCPMLSPLKSKIHKLEGTLRQQKTTTTATKNGVTTMAPKHNGQWSLLWCWQLSELSADWTADMCQAIIKLCIWQGKGIFFPFWELSTKFQEIRNFLSFSTVCLSLLEVL